MATYISIHDAKTIRASTVQEHNDCSPHITFEFDGVAHEPMARVTVYLPNAKFNQRLIDLINEIADEWQSVETAPVAEDENELPF
jgi:hypothetical protein